MTDGDRPASDRERLRRDVRAVATAQRAIEAELSELSDRLERLEAQPSE